MTHPASRLEKLTQTLDLFGNYSACPDDLVVMVGPRMLETVVAAARAHAALMPLLPQIRAALEISAGYVALVADGVGKMPILKDRAKSDCEIIGAVLQALDATQIGNILDGEDKP